MYHHKRRISVLLLVSILLTACQNPISSSNGAHPTPDPNVIAISFAAQERDRAVYEPLITQFQQTHPTIRVVFTPIESIRSSMADATDESALLRQLASQADTFATLILPHQFNPAYLTDLKPLIDADPTLDLNDFFPLAVHVSRHNEAIFQLPGIIPLALISYSKALWDDHGIPPPQPDWRWNDLFAIAAQLAQDHAQTGVFGTAGDMLPGMAFFTTAQANGIDLTTASAEQIRLDDPKMVTALQQVATLQQTGVISNSLFGRDAEQQISDHKAGMWLTMRGRGTVETAFAVGQLPAPITPLLFYTEGYQISRGTQHPQEAWQWLAFLSQQALPPDFFSHRSDMGMAPARIAFATRSTEWAPNWDAETRSAAEAYLQRLATTAAPATHTDMRLMLPLMHAVDNLFTAKQTPEQAAQEAQAMLEQQLAAAPTPAADPAPFTVAPPQLPVATEGVVAITFIPNSINQNKAHDLAKAFNQQDHGITITIMEDKDFKPLNDMAQRADCFTASSVSFEQTEPLEIVDLQPLLDRDHSAKPQEGLGWRVPFQRDGKQYGLPLVISFDTLNYHQTAFTQAGIAAPHSDWTAAEWLAAARALRVTSGAEQQFGYVALGSVANDVFDLLEYFGATLTTGAGATLQPALADTSFVNIARIIIDGLRETSPHTHITGYTKDETNAPNLDDIVQKGQAGMWLDDGFSDAPSTITVERAPVPSAWHHPDVVSLHTSIIGVFISAKTPHAEYPLHNRWAVGDSMGEVW